MKKILIVDDDQLNANMYATKLTGEGYEVFVCLEGQSALEKIKEKFDLILLDVMMPKIGGVEVLKEIKQSINKNAIVIVNTNLESEETKKECLDNGAKEYVIKVDYTPLQILEKVKKYLN